MVPLLAIVFAFDNTSGDLSLMLNVASLCGVAIGQVLFGVTADIYGRRKKNGFELLLVIIGTLGMVTTSGTSITLWSSLVFWRFIMGIGIGGGYPLSAIITAE
jgi:MFS transporter, PHS family, inorganic phosphate transporter